MRFRSARSVVSSIPRAADLVVNSRDEFSRHAACPETETDGKPEEALQLRRHADGCMEDRLDVLQQLPPLREKDASLEPRIKPPRPQMPPSLDRVRAAGGAAVMAVIKKWFGKLMETSIQAELAEQCPV